MKSKEIKTKILKSYELVELENLTSSRLQPGLKIATQIFNLDWKFFGIQPWVEI